MARHLLPASAQLIDCLGLRWGDSVVDVGTGTGNAAVVAVGSGARVLGIDKSLAQLCAATRRLADVNGTAAFVLGEAEALPVPDRIADLVISVFGVVFAGDPSAAVAEMARSCRSGGLVAVTSWPPGGYVRPLRSLLAAPLDERPPPFPAALGVPDEATTVFRRAGLRDVVVEAHSLVWKVDGVDDAVETLTTAAPVPHRLRQRLEDTGRWTAVRPAVAEMLGSLLRPSTEGALLDEPYLTVVGRRP